MKRAAIAVVWLSVMLISSVAIATHVLVPKVHTNEEIAYVSNWAEEGEPEPQNSTGIPLNASMRVESTYVEFHAQEQLNKIVAFNSQGRIGETTIFAAIDVPSGIPVDNRSFEAIQAKERGLLKMQGEDGRLLVLAGVNSALSLQAEENVTATFVVNPALDIFPAQDNQSVVIEYKDRDRYVLNIPNGNGSISVLSDVIRVSLDKDAELRGMIDGFPSTNAVANAAFDHVYLGQPASQAGEVKPIN